MASLVRVVLTSNRDKTAYRARVLPTKVKTINVCWRSVLAWGAGASEVEAVNSLNLRLAECHCKHTARATMVQPRRVDHDVFYLFNERQPPQEVH